MITRTTLANLEEYSPEHFVVKSVFEGKRVKANLLNLGIGQEVPIHPHDGSEIILIPQKGAAILVSDDSEEQLLDIGAVYYQGQQPKFGIKNHRTTPFQTLVLLVQIAGD